MFSEFCGVLRCFRSPGQCASDLAEDDNFNGDRKQGNVPQAAHGEAALAGRTSAVLSARRTTSFRDAVASHLTPRNASVLSERATARLSFTGNVVEGDQNRLSETRMFFDSMLSDMEWRAHAVTTLDTAASYAEGVLLSTHAIVAGSAPAYNLLATGSIAPASAPHPRSEKDPAAGISGCFEAIDCESYTQLHRLFGDPAGRAQQRPLAASCHLAIQQHGCSPLSLGASLVHPGLQRISALSAEAWLTAATQSTSPMPCASYLRHEALTAAPGGGGATAVPTPRDPSSILLSPSEQPPQDGTQPDGSQPAIPPGSSILSCAEQLPTDTVPGSILPGSSLLSPAPDQPPGSLPPSAQWLPPPPVGCGGRCPAGGGTEGAAAGSWSPQDPSCGSAHPAAAAALQHHQAGVAFQQGGAERRDHREGADRRGNNNKPDARSTQHPCSQDDPGARPLASATAIADADADATAAADSSVPRQSQPPRRALKPRRPEEEDENPVAENPLPSPNPVADLEPRCPDPDLDAGAPGPGRDPGGSEPDLHAPGSAPLVLVVRPLLGLLDDVGDLELLPAAPGASSGVATLMGTWRGTLVVVRLSFHADAPSAQPRLRSALLASRLQHPHLLPTLQVRGARVDEAALAAVDPPPALRPGWAPGGRPAGRLHRFLQAHAALRSVGAAADAGVGSQGGGGVGVGGRSLTVYPGDVISLPLPSSPLHRALRSLRPRPGGVVLASIVEAADLGNLQTLSCGPDSPFTVRRTWCLPVAQRALLRTAREIAAAVRVLHALGLTHGSLRPSNVLLCRSAADRRGFVAKVADAGSGSLARAAADPWASGPAIKLLAPEALADGTAVETRTADVYSYGMLLYMMAAGEMPFKGEPLVPVLVAVEADGRRPEWPAGHHDHLEPLYRRCVAQRPEDRPTFKQILAELIELEEQLKNPVRLY